MKKLSCFVDVSNIETNLILVYSIYKTAEDVTIFIMVALLGHQLACLTEISIIHPAHTGESVRQLKNK